MDAYCKRVKSGSSGELVDEKAASWRYFDRMNFLKMFIGSKTYVLVQHRCIMLKQLAK